MEPVLVTDVLASIPEAEPVVEPKKAPEQLTRKQIGQLRRQYVTVVKGTVKACGHKVAYDATKQLPKQPNNNCVYCWEAFFLTGVDLEGVHAIITQSGVQALIAQKGKKFTKMFHGFLSSKLLPALAAEIEPTPSSDPVQIDGGAFGVQKYETNKNSKRV